MIGNDGEMMEIETVQCSCQPGIIRPIRKLPIFSHIRFHQGSVFEVPFQKLQRINATETRARCACNFASMHSTVLGERGMKKTILLRHLNSFVFNSESSAPVSKVKEVPNGTARLLRTSPISCWLCIQHVYSVFPLPSQSH
jgi:deferrochelatase/peroxidase EfeB